MKKNNYILFVIIGSIILLSTLPFYNYLIDKHRVLNHDYHHAYNNIAINKPYLKVSYLLEHKNKYDTIVFGSSRNAALDIGKISKNTYNLDYQFGVAGAHLENLKTLLNNGVNIKNIWLGINDYIIWKNPRDHENDHVRKTYKNTFLSKIDFYSFYLFQKLNSQDLDILSNKTYLEESTRISQIKYKDYMNHTRNEEEKEKKEKTQQWIKKMSDVGGAVLGYQDGKTPYRIEHAMKEIKEIKLLCDKHKINLKIFIYPAFYKTYLQYNQYKIEEFKIKLANIINFYDFYALNIISIDELNWKDNSHFTVSVGDYIIESIQKNKHLVTIDNVSSRIKQTRQQIETLSKKYVRSKSIQRFNPNIDITRLTPIFKLKDNTFKYNKNTQFFKDEQHYYTGKKIHNGNPEIVLNNTRATEENVILTYRIESKNKTIFQIFYKKLTTSQYNEKDSYRVTLRKGLNKINLLIPSVYINNTLRIDPISNPGEYKIEELAIYGYLNVSDTTTSSKL